MLEWKLLAILTLHDRLVLIEWVQREIVKIPEIVLHILSLPLNWEVVLIDDRPLSPLKQMLLHILIWEAFHLRESLVATTLID